MARQTVMDLPRPAMSAASPWAVRFGAMQEIDGPCHHHPAHLHQDYEFLLVRHGTYEGTIDGIRIEARAPCLVVVRPGQQHGDATPDALRMDGLQCAVLPGEAPDRSARLVRQHLAPVIRLDGAQSQDFFQFFAAMGQAAQRQGDPLRGPYLDALAGTVVWRWLGLLAPDVLADEVSAWIKQGDISRRLEDYLVRHCRHHVTIDQMAKAVGIPVRTLTWHCQRVFSVSPAQLFRRHRLRFARAALLAGTTSVGEVAEEFGFSSTSHFARIYRQEFHRSPGSEIPAGAGAGRFGGSR